MTTASTHLDKTCSHVRAFGEACGALTMLALTMLAAAGCDPAMREPDTTATVAVTSLNDEQLQQKLDQVLTSTFQRRLNLQDHAAWQILHGALAFGREFLVESEPGGPLVSAVDHLLQGGRLKGWTTEPGAVWDDKTERRGLRALVEVGSKAGQGHPDQWFAVLAQCELEPSTAIQVDNRTYTMADFVAQVQWDVPRNLDREFSWTLIGLTAYLPANADWTAEDGKTWSIERLMATELDHELATSACGGSHRLIGIATALNHHLGQGGQLTGVWLEADTRIQEGIERAKRFQNPDGSFSSHYFERPGHSPDLAQDIGTTGHVLEFLTVASSDQQLRAPWVRSAAVHLCEVFEKTRELPLECGALYHAAHGLALYRQRMFPAQGS